MMQQRRHLVLLQFFVSIVFIMVESFDGWKPRQIPTGPLVIGYAHGADEKVVSAIKNGVNVVCWSFVDMNGKISANLNLQSIHEIRQQFPDVVFLAAIGGWNGPHPSGFKKSGKEWCDEFVRFNQENNFVFDGIDWDLEGHDDLSAPTSAFSLDVLNIMADFSSHAKHLYNMTVSMAPAESYLDAQSGLDFSLQLNLPPLAWSANQADRDVLEKAGFRHAGRQCYAYVLHKAGMDAFDWVSIQLYEAYSRYLYETAKSGVLPRDALLQRANAYKSGLVVKNMPQGDTTEIQIPLDKLVFGIGNGWTDGDKFVSVDPKDLAAAQSALMEKHGVGFRGAMFWTIDEEGTKGIHLAKSLNAALNQDVPEL